LARGLTALKPLCTSVRSYVVAIFLERCAVIGCWRISLTVMSLVDEPPGNLVRGSPASWRQRGRSSFALGRRSVARI